MAQTSTSTLEKKTNSYSNSFVGGIVNGINSFWNNFNPWQTQEKSDSKEEEKEETPKIPKQPNYQEMLALTQGLIKQLYPNKNPQIKKVKKKIKQTQTENSYLRNYLNFINTTVLPKTDITSEKLIKSYQEYTNSNTFSLKNGINMTSNQSSQSQETEKTIEEVPFGTFTSELLTKHYHDTLKYFQNNNINAPNYEENLEKLDDFLKTNNVYGYINLNNQRTTYKKIKEELDKITTDYIIQEKSIDDTSKKTIKTRVKRGYSIEQILKKDN